MRKPIAPGFPAFLALLTMSLVAAEPAQAQGAPPPGSYQERCRDIRMNGPYLSAWCRGVRASGQSTLNVQSCATDIGVDPGGGLICGGPEADGYGRPPGAYPPPGHGGGGGYRPPPGGDRWSATLYDRPGFRGRSIEIRGDEPNLDGSGLNDRVRSIRFNRRSGPWEVCVNAGFRGRCMTAYRSIGDTSAIGMWDSISSLRPLR